MYKNIQEDDMIIRSKIVRDTLLLTAMQLFLDTAALLLNVFITRSLGTSAIGILTLTGTFLGLAGVVSNGNAYLCTSRLISEELGRKNSCPERILHHGITLCLILSTATSAAVFIFAGAFSERFFGGSDMIGSIRLMPAALISGGVASCLKGWFNANRKSSVTAAGDILEFIVRCGVIVGTVLAAGSPDKGSVCSIMIGSIIAGNVFSLLFLTAVYIKTRQHSQGRGTLTFRGYTALAVPIMGGGILTSVLSSTNDALIPVCLRQYGDSAGEALSMFGVFEAIVIPTLFFPSVILCSMSGIIVSETARAAAAGDRRRISRLAGDLTAWTLRFSIFAGAVLMRFGGRIGELLGGGELAGRMITVIAPVVPFIYMEIISEAMIKGMGLQSFSSLNYLCEYAVRISVVLIFVPRVGFWGIAASYYASNIAGNCSRFIKLVRSSGMELRPFRTMIAPLIYVLLTMGTAELLVRAAGGQGTVVSDIALTLIWGLLYFIAIILLVQNSSQKRSETLSNLYKTNKKLCDN